MSANLRAAERRRPSARLAVMPAPDADVPWQNARHQSHQGEVGEAGFALAPWALTSLPERSERVWSSVVLGVDDHPLAIAVRLGARNSAVDGGTRPRVVRAGLELPRNETALINVGEGWKTVARTIDAIAAEHESPR